MNLVGRPDLLDHLAASYALGTLRGGARRRFEALARSSPRARVAAQLWQERFLSFTELQQGEAASPEVWKRIANLVATEARPAPAVPVASRPPELLRRARDWWRAGALAAAALAVASMALTLQLRGELQGRGTELAALQAQGRELARRNAELSAQLQSQPEVRYVAVLTDDKAAPELLATFDPRRGTLTLKRVGSFREGPEKSLQLWAIPPAGTPRSLGVLGEQPVLRLAAAEQVVGQSPALAISLEPRGGVSGENGPTGPVLWKGAVLQTPL
jgi:anti-sigma-K factor RskA